MTVEDDVEQLNKKKVLIVENNALTLSSLQQAIETAGFDAGTTWSGYEALALLKSRPFDVLLVDDYLPDLHSGDFLSRIGPSPTPTRIVVMQSSEPTADQVRHYRILGASAVVAKHNLAEVCKTVLLLCRNEPVVPVPKNEGFERGSRVAR
jgi:CheY-like chemotaxis protein